ncbi:MAG: hypothetical protein HXL16_05640 [Peptostreptococcaceae bacterium]|jgi:hypothetical protein|nr:hypothetical protein [Peptostreptococcaceae bacterium]
MVKLLAGSAGSGKTKIMIDNANKEIENVRGTFVYVESTDKHMQLLNSKIRFVSTEDIKIDSFSAMYGFICGLTSANYDIQKIYIDGILKIVKEDESKLAEFLEVIEKISNKTETEIMISATLQNSDTKKSLEKYIVEE